jgi:hypothetical protein
MEPSAAFAFRICEYLKGKKNRKSWIHRLNAVKHCNGHFYTLCAPLQEDLAKLFNYFRMKVSTFDEHLSRVQYHLKKSDIDMRAAIKPQKC